MGREREKKKQRGAIRKDFLRGCGAPSPGRYLEGYHRISLRRDLSLNGLVSVSAALYLSACAPELWAF